MPLAASKASLTADSGVCQGMPIFTRDAVMPVFTSATCCNPFADAEARLGVVISYLPGLRDRSGFGVACSA
jgi:hypothetical protein